MDFTEIKNICFTRIKAAGIFIESFTQKNEMKYKDTEIAFAIPYFHI
jgi:hypothetical protein